MVHSENEVTNINGHKVYVKNGRVFTTLNEKLCKLNRGISLEEMRQLIYVAIEKQNELMCRSDFGYSTD